MIRNSRSLRNACSLLCIALIGFESVRHDWRIAALAAAPAFIAFVIRNSAAENGTVSDASVTKKPAIIAARTYTSAQRLYTARSPPTHIHVGAAPLYRSLSPHTYTSAQLLYNARSLSPHIHVGAAPLHRSLSRPTHTRRRSSFTPLALPHTHSRRRSAFTPLALSLLVSCIQ
jgi:hypothetical protein